MPPSLPAMLARIRTLFLDHPNGGEPRGNWHSFDRHPWLHPWLTHEHLREMAEFSRGILAEARRIRESHRHECYRYGFVCNIANSMYSTAKALRPLGADIDVFPHPADSFLMSQPEWEDYDGSVAQGINTLAEAQSQGIVFPEVERVIRTATAGRVPIYQEVGDFVSHRKYRTWQEYYGYLPTLRALREYDALYAIQAPYLAYLSERPYWFECSRDDLLGRLQRAAFSQANLLIASNPWSFAFARRYGMRNVVCMPTLLNPDDYAPGHPDLRESWRQEIGGTFFVLTTARADDLFKGSHVALEGFRLFSQKNPDARLLLIGWGADLARHAERIQQSGLAGKVLWLPPAGKRRLIRYLRSAHVLLDQFVLGYFGMTALEAIAVGTPVVMRLEADQYGDFLDAGPPPVMNASNESEIAAALRALSESQDFLAQAGEGNRQWFMRYSGGEDMRESYLDVLAATAAGHRFNYTRSPLQMPLSKLERDYHQEQLRLAPTFPNYS